MMKLVPAEHRGYEDDIFDHDTSAQSPVDKSQCLCGPRWTAGGNPHHIYALHQRLDKKGVTDGE